MNKKEVERKLQDAHVLMSEVQKWAQRRMHSARGLEKSDHCFGYVLGIIVADTISAQEAIIRATVQLVYLNDQKDIKDE